MKFLSFLIISGFILLSSCAFAADGDWVLCDTCTTPAQFEAKAISLVGNFSGEFGYYVANSESE